MTINRDRTLSGCSQQAASSCKYVIMGRGRNLSASFLPRAAPILRPARSLSLSRATVYFHLPPFPSTFSRSSFSSSSRLRYVIKLSCHVTSSRLPSHLCARI